MNKNYKIKVCKKLPVWRASFDDDYHTLTLVEYSKKALLKKIKYCGDVDEWKIEKIYYQYEVDKIYEA